MLKYFVKPLHGVPFTPGSMPALFENDHMEIFHIGCKWLLYSCCRMWITVTVKSYHWACDRRNKPEKFSCFSHLGSFGPNALVYLTWISDVIKIGCVVWYFNGVIGISLVRQLTET